MIKRFLLAVILMGFFVFSYADYKRLTDYQNILYKQIEDYVEQTATTSPQAVFNFIYSQDTHTVFTDAKASGYSRKDLIFGTYQSSFGVSAPKQVIIQALHDATMKENQAYDAAFYTSFVTLALSSITSLAFGRYLWTYFKHDRPAIEYYRNNGHLYMRTTETNASRVSTATTTTPLMQPLIIEESTRTTNFWGSQ